MKQGDKIIGYFRHEYEVLKVQDNRCFLKKSNGEIFSMNVDVVQTSIDARRSKLIARGQHELTH